MCYARELSLKYISVRFHYIRGLKGHHNPAGYISRWHNIPESDALVAQILARAGAVIVARTTEPQSMMQLETSSNLYGTTVNPFNTALSAGGSSGGEAALVAMGGSVIGVGSDVGGSIRVPAAACGIFGLKPTAFRVPTTGNGSIAAGADYVQSVIGPLSRTLEGIELFMQAVLDAEPWRLEPALTPLPWRTVDVRPTQARPLRLGIMWHDGVVLPHPPITRALTELVERVRKMEHTEIVHFRAYKHDEAWAITSSLYFADGGEADIAAIEESGEPLLPLTEWIVKENECLQKLDRGELEYWLEEREEYRLEYAKEWNNTGTWNEDTGQWERTVDALVCPVAPGVATRPGTAKYWYYTSTWNLLDYPAMAFPAGKANERLDGRVARKTYMSDLDRDNWALCEWLRMDVSYNLLTR